MNDPFGINDYFPSIEDTQNKVEYEVSENTLFDLLIIGVCIILGILK